ncbi:MAG: glycosyltransferase, partial [Clostridia bacterium]|nr:glycosyltransferase [Clostridia bacterium]
EDGYEADSKALERLVMEVSCRIEGKFIRLFEEYSIDMIIPNNLLSLGRSPQIAIALTKAAVKTGVTVIGHHHDFYFEREYFGAPSSEFVKGLLEDYFPPREITGMRHVVINKPAGEELFRRRGLKSHVVPNVFDFDAPDWIEDKYNSTFNKDMGIHDNQVVFLQATRVTNRKAIELAIDLVAMLNKDEFRRLLLGRKLYNGKIFNDETELVLNMVGMHEGGGNYEQKLIDYAKERNVNLIIKPELVSHSRHMREGRKIYSLWDAYVYCDIITYPSIYEGWGNQFLEGLFAKKPQVVFEYSVFESDIKQYGFEYISLGNEYGLRENAFAVINDDMLREAAWKTIEYLTDKSKYEECVNRNFKIAKKELSLDALERMIVPIINGDDS